MSDSHLARMSEIEQSIATHGDALHRLARGPYFGVGQQHDFMVVTQEITDTGAIYITARPAHAQTLGASSELHAVLAESTLLLRLKRESAPHFCVGTTFAVHIHPSTQAP